MFMTVVVKKKGLSSYTKSKSEACATNRPREPLNRGAKRGLSPCAA